MEKLTELTKKEMLMINGGAENASSPKPKWYTFEGWVTINYNIGKLAGRLLDRAEQVGSFF